MCIVYCTLLSFFVILFKNLLYQYPQLQLRTLHTTFLTRVRFLNVFTVCKYSKSRMNVSISVCHLLAENVV